MSDTVGMSDAAGVNRASGATAVSGANGSAGMNGASGAAFPAGPALVGSGQKETIVAEMLFCDLFCRHASWPEEGALDGAGSCRTFAALYCALKKRPVFKNMPCPDKVPREREERPQGER